MGIGPGIVTKSAKRPKYKLDAKMTYRYSYHHRKRYVLLYDGGGFAFLPKFHLRERWAVREMQRQKDLSPEELQTFYNALCNRSERVKFNKPFPPEIERYVDWFIAAYPRWRPERNKIGRLRKMFTPYYKSL